MTTLRGARESLGATLTAALSASYEVLDYEPGPGRLNKPTSVTVATAGMTATDYRLYVRCYSDTSRVKPEDAEDALDNMVEATEDALPVEVPRSSWAVEWSEIHDAFIATTVAEFPRDDF